MFNRNDAPGVTIWDALPKMLMIGGIAVIVLALEGLICVGWLGWYLWHHVMWLQ